MKRKEDKIKYITQRASKRRRGRGDLFVFKEGKEKEGKGKEMEDKQKRV